MKMVSVLLILISQFAFARIHDGDIERACSAGRFSDRICGNLISYPIVQIMGYAHNFHHGVRMDHGTPRVFYRPTVLGPEQPQGIMTVIGGGVTCRAQIYLDGYDSDPDAWLIAHAIECH